MNIIVPGTMVYESERQLAIHFAVTVFNQNGVLVDLDFGACRRRSPWWTDTDERRQIYTHRSPTRALEGPSFAYSPATGNPSEEGLAVGCQTANAERRGARGLIRFHRGVH